MPNLTEQLKRDGNLLTRSQPKGKAPRRRIPAMSKKRQREAPSYAKIVREHLKEYPECQIGPIIRAAGFTVNCTAQACHVHHKRHRGRFLCDRSTFLSACSGECHIEWVHRSHVKEAYALGLLLR